MPAAGRGDPEREFLRVEVTGVLRHGIDDVAREPDRDRPLQRDLDRDPGLDRRPRPVAPFEVADLRLAEPHPLTQFRLGETTAPSCRLRVAAEVRGDRLRFSCSCQRPLVVA